MTDARVPASVVATVALAVRRLRQEQIGAQLTADLTPAETTWLDADARQRGSRGAV
jgi:hypothetical protein